MPACRLISAATMLLVAVVAAHAVPPIARDTQEIDPQAAAVVRRFGEGASGLRSFSVTVNSKMETAPPATLLGAGFQHRISAQRPAKFRVENISRDGGAMIINDGKTLVLYAPGLKKYQERTSPAHPEQTMAVAGPGGEFLTMLFAADPAKSCMEGVSACRYVGQERIDGQDADHLIFLMPGDGEGPFPRWDVWFRHDAPALPLKMVPEFEGQGIEAAFAYTEWQINVAIDDGMFIFKPPEGVEKSATLFDEAAR